MRNVAVYYSRDAARRTQIIISKNFLAGQKWAEQVAASERSRTGGVAGPHRSSAKIAQFLSPPDTIPGRPDGTAFGASSSVGTQGKEWQRDHDRQG
jgi:hypothetical protein